MNEQKEQISTGIDPKLKKEINAEGYDDDGGYLIVGTPEERDLARQRIESEGRTESLGAYIKLHKEIKLPIDAPVLENRKRVQDLMKNIKGQGAFFSSDVICYIDKDGNYCDVEIDKDKIAELRDLPEADIKKKFEDLGFNLTKGNVFYQNWGTIVDVLREHLQEIENKEIENKEFDF